MHPGTITVERIQTWRGKLPQAIANPSGLALRKCQGKWRRALPKAPSLPQPSAEISAGLRTQTTTHDPLPFFPAVRFQGLGQQRQYRRPVCRRDGRRLRQGGRCLCEPGDGQRPGAGLKAANVDSIDAWPAGSVILALIHVLVIAFVMYLIVRAIEAMRRKEEAAAGPDPQAQLASAVTG